MRASAYEFWEDTDIQSITPLRDYLPLDNRLEQPFLLFYLPLIKVILWILRIIALVIDRGGTSPSRCSPGLSSSLGAAHCPLGSTPYASHTRNALPLHTGQTCHRTCFSWWSETEALIFWGPGAALQSNQTHYMERCLCPIAGDIFSPAIWITKCTLEPNVFGINHWISEETRFP